MRVPQPQSICANAAGKVSDMTKIDTYGPYFFGTSLDLDQAAKDGLFRLFDTSPDSSGGVLSGRPGPLWPKYPVRAQWWSNITEEGVLSAIL